jgi:chromosome segregation ATPase
LARV